MSIDFFNEGFKKQPAIEYSQQEQMFLASKISFLDPKKTNNIQIGSVTQFCTMGQIKGAIIKKILTNCKLDGKRLVTYDQMKKVFRAISLVQKGLEPSWINITANIKLPMPKLDDQYSDSEEQVPKKAQKQPIKPAIQPKVQPAPKVQATSLQPPPANQAKVAQFAQFGQFLAKPPQNQPKPQKQQIQKPKPVQQQKSQSSNNNLKQFEAYWNTLNTKNNKIDGGEVKQICKNLAQRSNLSKAWKLCCISHQGSLTKGEFYVFLLIVKMNNVPQALSSQMKEAILRIDRGNHKSVQKQKTRTESQLGASQIFDNFGKSQLSITNPHVHRPTNQPAVQRPSTNQILSQLSTKIIGKFDQNRKQLIQQQKTSQQQLLQLRRQQQIMSNMMGEVQQFMTSVNTRNNRIRKQIDQLKNNQLAINQRFNNVCMAMNQVIVKQNSFIQELMGEISELNNINSQKAAVLENYVAHTEANRAQTQQTYRRQQKRTIVIQVPPQQSKPSIKIIEPVQSREVVPPPVSPRYQSPLSPRQSFTSPPAPQPSPVAPEEEHESPQSEHEKEEQEAAVPPPQHQEGNLSQQQIQDQNRIKMKQMQLIQLINYLSPITPSQYPQIVKKITSYHQSALNQAYQKLYMKIKQKQMLQQQRARQAAASQSNPTTDEFNSSNFTHEQNNQGTNFFG